MIVLQDVANKVQENSWEMIYDEPAKCSIALPDSIQLATSDLPRYFERFVYALNTLQNMFPRLAGTVDFNQTGHQFAMYDAFC